MTAPRDAAAAHETLADATGDGASTAGPRRGAVPGRDGGGLRIGYARVSTDQQDLSAQRDALTRLRVPADRVYVDHGLTGTTRERPGLRQALAACRAGDTLVVTKLDRLARSLPDARAIAEELTDRSIRLDLGGSTYDPVDPVGRLLFNVLAMVAEFEADLIRARTREGMAVARAKGRLRGRQPKLTARQEAHLVALYDAGGHTVGELEELFGVTRSTVYRAIRRARVGAGVPLAAAPTAPAGDLVSTPARAVAVARAAAGAQSDVPALEVGAHESDDGLGHGIDHAARARRGEHEGER